MAKKPRGDYDEPMDESATDRMLMVPGMKYPLVVPEGGHEGARAVCEYRTHVEGRIVTGVDYDADNECAKDKFRQYDQDFIVNDGIDDGNDDAGGTRFGKPKDHDFPAEDPYSS